MSIPTEEFPQICRAITGRDILTGSQTSLIRPRPGLMARLLRLHKAIGLLARKKPAVFANEEVNRASEGDLVHLLVRCLAEGADLESRSRSGDAVIARFEDFILANSDRPLYLTEVCTALDVGERWLRAACEEHLGMGPIRYLTLRRMHLVRRALL